jgi:hypothetical protein
MFVVPRVACGKYFIGGYHLCREYLSGGRTLEST